MDYNLGYLRLFLGGVRSGKSARGLSRFIHYDGLDQFNPIIAIPSWTIRPDDPVYTKYKIEESNIIKIERDQTVEESLELLEAYNVVIIDECQFYPHLKAVVLRLLVQKKRVYLCGLDGDIHGDPMGEVLLMIPHCNKVTKLTGRCVRCIRENRAIVNEAIMSMLRVQEIEVVEVKGESVVKIGGLDTEIRESVVKIGGLDTYDPVCRYHYLLGN